ncbi:MAG: hypothetical protein ABSH20_13220 [Tepidisphaeraceae bacterium]|jgi:hypothetical protein
MRNSLPVPQKRRPRRLGLHWRLSAVVLQHLATPLVLLVLAEIMGGAAFGLLLGHRVRAVFQLTLLAVGAAILYLTGLGAAADWRERQRWLHGQCINCGYDHTHGRSLPGMRAKDSVACQPWKQERTLFPFRLEFGNKPNYYFTQCPQGMPPIQKRFPDAGFGRWPGIGPFTLIHCRPNLIGRNRWYVRSRTPTACWVD